MATTGRILAPAVVSAGVVIVVLLFGIAGTSSRAGAIFSVVALVGGMTMLPLERVGLRRSYVLGGAAAVMLALAGGLGLVLSGTLLSGRFAWGSDTRERVDLLPQFLRVIHDFFPFGSGLGSFEPVFKSYEKAESLSFGYWNQAHQDYAQVAIEAGLAGIALTVAFLVWYGVRVVGIWRARRRIVARAAATGDRGAVHGARHAAQRRRLSDADRAQSPRRSRFWPHS